METDVGGVIMDENLYVLYALFKNQINKVSQIGDVSKIIESLNKKLDISMNMEVYKKVISLPYQYYRNRTTGEIISKISELGKVRTFVNNIVVIIFLDVPIALVAGIILYFIEEKLFFLSFFS